MLAKWKKSRIKVDSYGRNECDGRAMLDNKSEFGDNKVDGNKVE